ncbi:MAG: hypothetical protein AB7P03_16355 [Kofleriaceae bacterium]
MIRWQPMVVLALVALATACAARSANYGDRAPAASAPEAVATPQGSAREQLDDLSKNIDDDLARLGLPPAAPAACVSASCMNAEPSNLSPPLEDPACRPAKSELCTDTCKLAESICSNAGKICQIAKDLGDNDAYANGKCISGKASCDAAKQKCCGCQL